jgi:hypothetical protein
MENKTGKYLKYAIGEIILVVIGILIALQINNFNEQRKDRTKEQVIIKHLKEDYQTDLLQLEDKMAMRNAILKSAFDIFKAIDFPDKIIRDSLINDIATISDDPTFDPIQNDFISSGNLRLITNEKLTRLLSNWSSDIVALQEVETNWSNIVNQQIEPVMAQLGISRDVANSYMNDLDHLWLLDSNSNSTKTTIGTSKIRTPISEIVTSRALEGIASAAVTYNKPANITSESLVKRINEIINLIDTEIKEK